MKKLLLALMTAISALCLSFGFAACGEEGKTPDENQQQTEQTPNEQKPGENQEQQTPSEKPDENQQDSNEEQENTSAPVYLGMSIESSAPQTIMPMTIYPSLSIWAQGDEVYQSRTDTEILINIHFENPEQYEILSFTLNKKKFASNMFERESDLENIILKVAVGDFDEVTEYTIDAIKYIDGEMIKDVKIGGDQTVKLYREYAITYHDIFEAEYPTEYTILSDTISFEDLSRAGYTFGGWFEDEAYTKEIGSIEKGSKGDRDIYAKWEIVNYNIEYVLDGGENPEENPKTYTVEEELKLAPATKEGHYFSGWYLDEELKKPFGQLTDEIEFAASGKDLAADFKLYAKWVEGTSGLKFKPAAENKSFIVDRKYEGEDTEVVIPSEYMGLPVTEIGDSAFFNCKKVKSVAIPESVTKIGVLAFSSCNGLTSVTLPKNVTEIEQGGFNQCENLETVILPEGLKKIGKGVFFECKSLKSITIPDGVESIDEATFSGCEKLESIVIPDSVKMLGRGLFGECKALKSVKIGKGVTTLESMFSGCDELTEVEISENIDTIKENVFQNCKALKTITYLGTKAQWESIEKDEKWNERSSVEKIHCSDGDVSVGTDA